MEHSIDVTLGHSCTSRRAFESFEPTKYFPDLTMGEVVEASRGIGMIRPKARLVDCERAPVHWLGLNEAARGLEQLGEVVEVYRGLGTIRPKSAWRQTGAA